MNFLYIVSLPSTVSLYCFCHTSEQYAIKGLLALEDAIQYPVHLPLVILLFNFGKLIVNNGILKKIFRYILRNKDSCIEPHACQGSRYSPTFRSLGSE